MKYITQSTLSYWKINWSYIWFFNIPFLHHHSVHDIHFFSLKDIIKSHTCGTNSSSSVHTITSILLLFSSTPLLHVGLKWSPIGTHTDTHTGTHTQGLTCKFLSVERMLVWSPHLSHFKNGFRTCSVFTGIGLWHLWHLKRSEVLSISLYMGQSLWQAWEHSILF